MVGRVVFIVLGCVCLVGSWVFSLGDSPVGTPAQHQLFSYIGIGFMLAAIACGVAERGRPGVDAPPAPPRPPAPPTWATPVTPAMPAPPAPAAWPTGAPTPPPAPPTPPSYQPPQQY